MLEAFERRRYEAAPVPARRRLRKVQGYFAHLERWLASSEPLFYEFSPAA